MRWSGPASFRVSSNVRLRETCLEHMSAYRILVTGGSGFLGSAIVEAFRLAHGKWEIVVADVNRPQYLSAAENCAASYVQLDVTDVQQAHSVIETVRPAAIVHAAGLVPKGSARYGQQQREMTFKVNVDGTSNMLNAAQKFGVKAFVYTSSCTVMTVDESLSTLSVTAADNISQDDKAHDYANMAEDWPVPPPSSTLIYGASKAKAEAIVRAANDPSKFMTCILRPSVVLGPGDNNLIPTLHTCIAKYETPFVIGSGTNLYDFTYLSNVADAHFLAVNDLLQGPFTAAGETFFISNGEPIPFRALCLAVWNEFGHVPPFTIEVPRILAQFAGLLSDAWTWLSGTAATLSRGSVMDAMQIGYADCRKAKRVLGYRPRVKLEEAIRISCQEYKKRLEEFAIMQKRNCASSQNGSSKELKFR